MCRVQVEHDIEQASELPVRSALSCCEAHSSVCQSKDPAERRVQAASYPHWQATDPAMLLDMTMSELAVLAIHSGWLWKEGEGRSRALLRFKRRWFTLV